MQALIIFFVELCALRRAPQDLPASPVLLALVVVANLITGMLVGLVAGLSMGLSLMQTAIEIVLTLLALDLALRVTRHAGRLLQAGTALLGAGVVLGLVALVPLSLKPTGSQETDLAALGALLLLALLVWNVVVIGHVLRHTFGITLGQGALIGMAFQFGTLLLLSSLFGGA